MDASQTSNDMSIVTPSDADVCNGVGFVFAGGDLAVITAKGNTVVIPQAFERVVFPQAIQKVLVTGTTATAVLVFRG